MNAFCEPPTTISSPQPSMSSGMVPSPVIASTMQSASVPLQIFAERPHVVRRARRGLRGLEQQALRVRILRSACFTLSGETTSPYSAFRTMAFRSERLGQVHPAFAEFAGRADDDLVAFGEEVRDRRFQRARPGETVMRTSPWVPKTSFRSARTVG
jgi:hypothetical protein